MSETPGDVGFGKTYRIPLTEEEFAILGKIAALFGAVEFCIDAMMMKLAGLDTYFILETMYDGKQFGSKVTMLKRLAALTLAGEKFAAVNDACKELDSVAGDRNHAIHGSWGHLYSWLSYLPDIGPKNSGDPKPAAFSWKRPNDAMLASELPSLLDRVEAATRKTHDAWVLVTGASDPQSLPLTRVFTNGLQKPPSSPPKSPQPSRKLSHSPRRKRSAS